MWKFPLMLIFITCLLSSFSAYGCPTCVARSDEHNAPFFEDESSSNAEEETVAFNGTTKESL